MSYINDALRKVQKEKESRYAAYEQIVSAPGKRIDRSRKWLSIIAILMVFLGAVGIIALLYWPEDTKVPLIRRISAPPVASVVVAGQKPDNNTTVELQPPEKTAQVRTKQDIAKAKALFAQALERQREGKLKEAKELYQKVVKIDQDNVQAFNNLGVIDMGEKKYKRAIMRFNEALNIKHDYPDAHYNLACLYAQKHDVSRSLLYLKNAIEFNPEVRKWAKNDGDLKDLTDLPAFKKLFGETIKLR
jgi:tetratricopeptide (TPR) repeat protein